MATLRLLVDSYDQPVSDDRRLTPGGILLPPETVPRTKGELFEPRDQAEYDRLTELGAAEDPEQAEQRARQELERRRQEIEVERERLDAELSRLDDQDPAQLKGKALDAALEDRGLSTDGSAAEKRQRLAGAVADDTPPPPG